MFTKDKLTSFATKYKSPEALIIISTSLGTLFFLVLAAKKFFAYPTDKKKTYLRPLVMIGLIAFTIYSFIYPCDPTLLKLSPILFGIAMDYGQKSVGKYKKNCLKERHTTQINNLNNTHAANLKSADEEAEKKITQQVEIKLRSIILLLEVENSEEKMQKAVEDAQLNVNYTNLKANLDKTQEENGRLRSELQQIRLNQVESATQNAAWLQGLLSQLTSTRFSSWFSNSNSPQSAIKSR